MAILAIAWATCLNRTPVARAIAAAIATVLRSVAAAIANKYVIRNIDQSNGEKAFQISPTSFNITLLIGWFYAGRKPNNGTAVRHQLWPRLSPQANSLLDIDMGIKILFLSMLNNLVHKPSMAFTSTHNSKLTILKNLTTTPCTYNNSKIVFKKLQSLYPKISLISGKVKI